MSSVPSKKKIGPGGSVMTNKSSRKLITEKATVGSRGFDSTISRNTRATVNSNSDKTLSVINKPIIQVFLSGKDVTPLPLVDPESNQLSSRRPGPTAIDNRTVTSNDFMATSTYHQTGAKMSYAGPFTRSVFSSQSGKSGIQDSDDLDSITDSSIACNWTQVTNTNHTPFRRPNEDSTEMSLTTLNHAPIDIVLSETDTIWLLDKIGTVVNNECEDIKIVEANNEIYNNLLKARLGNDRYMERGMNTFNQLPKYKSVQTDSVNHRDIGTMCTNWDMHDSYEEIQQKEIADALAALTEAEAELPLMKIVQGRGSPTSLQGDEDSSKRNSLCTKRTFNSQDTQVSTVAPDSYAKGKAKAKKNALLEKEVIPGESKILKNEQFKRDLVVMERVVNLNTYQQKLACYRNFPIVEDIDKQYRDALDEDDLSQYSSGDTLSSHPRKERQPETSPTIDKLAQIEQRLDNQLMHARKPQVTTVQRVASLDRLWAYQCNLTKGRNVSSIAWNKANPDLLAVCYGQYEFSKQKRGMICCWSVKNPEYPERIYHTRCGVTSISWSSKHHNLLAAGLYNGTISIFNVRSTSGESILDSLDSASKHIDPVWQLCWIEKDRGTGDEKTEVLVSCSTDGRVTQWSIRKGFESYDLMKLKKMIQKQPGQTKTKKAEAFISRYAGGLCFSFTPNDTNIYLVGTEEGHIHRCSCSYNEQYLESYFGHTGPVYKIVWSPFCPELFLSCSGDWSIRLWHVDYPEPIVTLLSSTRGVPDITWSTTQATVFVCVNEGAIEVWDLGQSILDPVVVNAPPTSAQLSTVAFCLQTQCIVVGDSEGQIAVYQLTDMPTQATNQSDELMKIVKTCLATRLQD